MALELPNHRDLSPRILERLSTSTLSPSPSSYNNSNNGNMHMMMIMMVRVRDLGRGLSKECVELDSHLFHLHNSLSNLIISWISRSIAAKTAIRNLNLTTSSPGERIRQTVKQGLPQLAMELNQIENIRSYLNTALWLEAMIGDLEDAAFSVISHQTGNDHESRQHNFFQAIRFMNKIEDLLGNPLQFKCQWQYLMNVVDSRVDKTLALLRPQILASHRALLSCLGWPPKVLSSKIENGNISLLPNPLVLMQTSKRKAYSESFLAVCALQHLKTRRDERQLGLSEVEKNQNSGLWAINEMVYPISSRLEIHFSKWTNQPEFIFALAYKVTKDFMVGVDNILQPLIDKAKLVGVSAKEAWVSAMVQMLSTFLAKRVFSNLSERYNEREMRTEVISSWLQLVDLMVKFDKQFLSLVSSDTYLLCDEIGRCGGCPKCLSIFSLFFDRPDWLKIWAKIELKYRKMKLKEEVKNENAWFTNSNQGVGLGIGNFVLYCREDYNAPLITEYALNLAWEMVESCKRLPGIYTKIKFIRSTSAKVIWYFMNLLISRSKGVKFSATGSDYDSVVKLCGLINAAKYCEFKLKEWNDDIYFLEMSMAEREMKEFLEDGVKDNCLFFGEETKSLADMELNWLMQIITDILNQFEIFTLDYIHDKLSFEQREEEGLRVSKAMDVPVSNCFVEALDTLKNQLSVLKASLNPKDFSDLWRHVANGLDHFLHGSIFLSNYRFSRKGAEQLEADIQALFLVFKPFCARPEAFFPRSRDALRLLVIDRRYMGASGGCVVECFR